MAALSVYLLIALAIVAPRRLDADAKPMPIPMPGVYPRQSNTTATNSTKAGLAWPNGNTVDMGQYESTGKVSWYYTWSVFPTSSALEYVPMFWGEKSIDQFSSMIDQVLGSSSNKVTAVLGMNEPDQPGQSNIPPETGVQLWTTYMEPLRARGLRLGSPALSSAPAGKVWLQDFFTQCAGRCSVDFIALHWYGTDAQAFIAYLEDYHNTFQKPLWVTEWACQNFVNLNAQCSAESVAEFLNTTQGFMDATDYVERYSWYGAMPNTGDVNPSNALMDRNGRINALGNQYIAAANASTSGTTSGGGSSGTGGTKGGGGSGGGLPSILNSQPPSFSISLWTLVLPVLVFNAASLQGVF